MNMPDDYEIRQCHDMVLMRDDFRNYEKREIEGRKKLLIWLRQMREVEKAFEETENDAT